MIPGSAYLSRAGYSAHMIGGPTMPSQSYPNLVAWARMGEWKFELTVSDDAAELVRRRGGTVALDFIPPIS